MASTNQDNKSNNIDIQKMVEFVKKNARYFVAGALFVVLLLILVKFTGNGTGNADDNNVAVTETVVTEEAYEENAVPAVNELINNYFTAPEILSHYRHWQHRSHRMSRVISH